MASSCIFLVASTICAIICEQQSEREQMDDLVVFTVALASDQG
jgi:hypothetical protein